MAGRVALAHRPAGRQVTRRIVVLTIAALMIFALGVFVGDRIGADAATSASPSSVASPARSASPTSGNRAGTTPVRPNVAAVRTRAGAATAASAAITAFELSVVLDAARLEATIATVAAHGYREQLLATYRQGAAAFREKLGIGSTPEPVVFVRTSPIAYRVEEYSASEATVSVWTVGVLGSGATVTPQQTWSTQRVALRWEDGGWKVAGFDRQSGPTPPLASAESADSPTTLFSAIPSFEPYRHAAP